MLPTQDKPMHRTLLITGGSRGIGAATARLAATRGWDVAINFHSDAVAAQAVADEVQRAGRRALLLQADVGAESEAKAMFAELDRAWGPGHLAPWSTTPVWWTSPAAWTK
jgi:NAD(P)-dependent dehydrogenase (short-subunit alcohol dehydrogenase family)